MQFKYDVEKIFYDFEMLKELCVPETLICKYKKLFTVVAVKQLFCYIHSQKHETRTIQSKADTMVTEYLLEESEIRHHISLRHKCMYFPSSNLNRFFSYTFIQKSFPYKLVFINSRNAKRTMR